MGCDIHAVIQIKDPERTSWGWEAVGVPDHSRSYFFFGLLGLEGRIDHENPICSFRGLPEDFDWPEESWAQFLDSEGHSPSWFSLRDVERYDSSLIENRQQWDRWVQLMYAIRNIYEVTNDEVRVVYNFDN